MKKCTVCKCLDQRNIELNDEDSICPKCIVHWFLCFGWKVEKSDLEYLRSVMDQYNKDFEYLRSIMNQHKKLKGE